MKRYGRAVRIRPDKLQEYRSLHAAAWPEVLAALRAANVRNYTLFERGGLVLSYFEYVGADYAADRERLLADPAMVRWNRLTGPCVEPLEPGGEPWAPMDEIFHMD
jgi:L-rhamnose mutarotase